MTARIVSSYGELTGFLQEERDAGHTIALANGCFDVLHVGHVRLLDAARSEADVLVVALNDDESVRENKGPGRPFVPLVERLELMAALEGVHYVTSFGEPTAHELIETLRPDVHVKGTDWEAADVPEREVVERHGGRIVIAGDPKTHSSTELVEKLERSRGERPSG